MCIQIVLTHGALFVPRDIYYNSGGGGWEGGGNSSQNGRFWRSVCVITHPYVATDRNPIFKGSTYSIYSLWMNRGQKGIDAHPAGKFSPSTPYQLSHGRLLISQRYTCCSLYIDNCFSHIIPPPPHSVARSERVLTATIEYYGHLIGAMTFRPRTMRPRDSPSPRFL
jgi:hypothetical protein